jgi:hypothetical protein
VHATVSAGAHELLQVVLCVVRSAQHVEGLAQAVCGHAPVPPPLLLLLPLELPPAFPPELPPEFPPELPPEFPPELPPEFPPEPPPVLPPELPEPPLLVDPPPPPSGPLALLGELLPHAIQTNELAMMAAAPTATLREVRDSMTYASDVGAEP